MDRTERRCVRCGNEEPLAHVNSRRGCPACGFDAWTQGGRL